MMPVLGKYKRQVAAFFRRYPRLGYLGQRVWRLPQAHYSIGAVGVVFDDQGRLLLLEHVFHPTRPWGLPGGWVDRREAPDAAIERELREETNLCVTALYPVLVEPASYRGHLDIAYLCHLVSGEIRLSSEILDYRWVHPTDLPDLFAFQHRAIEHAVRLRECMTWA